MKITQLHLTDWKSFADSGVIELDQVNVIMGRNNSGKSAILQAILLMQMSSTSTTCVRLGSGGAKVEVTFTGGELSTDLPHYFQTHMIPAEEAHLSMQIGSGGGTASKVNAGRQLHVSGTDLTPPPIRAEEPKNFIYPYLSKRKVHAFNRQFDLAATNAVTDNLANLYAKIDRLSELGYAGEPEYSRLCEQILRFRVGSYTSSGGHQSGISIGLHDRISLEEMGEGVSSLLGLITDLCMADGNLFLIEEPENDIHPESLKALLDAIVEKSDKNQFVITTHSNIVTRYLGAAQKSKLFVVESEIKSNEVPTSTIREVEGDAESRVAALRDLGYELSDFYLNDAWLILEESSAQTFIQHLIQWFVPNLMRIRIMSASGVDNVEPMLKDYRRLFLYAHLEPHYKKRTWVIVDGDEAGQGVISSLKNDLGTWPEDRFRALGQQNFEFYYPPQFRKEAEAALSLTDKKEKKRAKEDLVIKVDQWCKDNPDEAKAAFQDSATEVIEILKEINGVLARS